MKVINLNNQKEQGKTPEQIEFSEMITRLCWVAFLFGIIYLFITHVFKHYSGKQIADFIISFSTYFCLFMPVVFVVWIIIKQRKKRKFTEEFEIDNGISPL